jgi:putative CRISPR-associated protein (TIGR02620 family)
MNEKHEVPSEYADARDDFQAASASLAIARRKQGRVNCWEWANVAARHAEMIGIGNARDLLGTNPYPNLSALDAALATMRKDELVIVTRHAGLAQWLNSRGYNGRVVERATPSDVLNKHVIGKLPMHLAAITASVTNIHVPNVPEDKRGQELTASELDKYLAYMRTYIVKEVSLIEP